MQALTTPLDLTEALKQEADKIAPETPSFGVVFLTNATLTVDDLVALKKSALVCDVSVVVSLSKGLSIAQQKLIEEAGAQLYYIHKPQPHLSIYTRVTTNTGEDITAYLEALLLIMPSMVFSHIERIDHYRALQSLYNQFKNLFTLEVCTTPLSALNPQEKILAELMENIYVFLDQGERRIPVLAQHIHGMCVHKKLENVEHITFLNGNTLLKERDTLPKESILCIRLKEGGNTYQRHLKITI